MAIIWDELQLLIIGTNCRFFKMGRIDAWDELSLFGIWDELSLGTNRRLGRIVALRFFFSRTKLTDLYSAPNQEVVISYFFIGC